MKKLLFLVVLGVALMVVDSAFAVELRFMTVWGGKQKEYLDQMFAEYTSLNPKVRISHETVPGTGAASYTEVLQTGLASGTGPDLFFNWGGELAGNSKKWESLGCSYFFPCNDFLVQERRLEKTGSLRTKDVRRVRGYL